MTSVSPPKPWERAGASAAASMPSSVSTGSSSATASSTPATTGTTAATPSSTSTAPSLPSRPSTLTSASPATAINSAASAYSPYGATRLGASPYGGYGGYNSYSSPYSRFGNMYGGMGGMGGYGGMYGGMGGMGGMGGYGGMYGGMPPNGDPNSLTQSFNQSTAATFQMIESIVGAFGGLAQMLESTYMATHSSFFAMVSVAEQFGNLRNTLGQMLGIYTIARWMRTLLAKLTGRPPPADAMALTPAAFASFAGKSTLPDGSSAPAKPSKKPFFFFIAAVFGLPYLMNKLIRTLARSQEAAAQRQQDMLVKGGQAIDPSKLEFCRVLYDYSSEAQNTNGIDLAVKKGDLVAVLSRTDPLGNPSDWWRCRARDGSVGYLPSPYLGPLQRKPQQQVIAAPPSDDSSRTSTLLGTEDRPKDLVSAGKGEKPQLPSSKIGDISPESFQKSTFYS